MGKAIKVSDAAYQRLADVASQEGVTIGNVVERLLEGQAPEGRETSSARLGELERRVEGLEDDHLTLEEEVRNASYLIRHGFGSNRIKIRCPLCKEWGYLTFDKERERWVCGECREVPF